MPRGSRGKKILRSLSLEHIEQTLADREQTKCSTGKKNRVNERLITQWRERAGFDLSDFGDELIKHLALGFDLSSQKPKQPQIIDGSLTQLFCCVSEQNRAAQRPDSSDAKN